MFKTFCQFFQFGLLFLSQLYTLAQSDTSNSQRRLTVDFRVVDVVIDGNLDEALWKSLESSSSFKMNFPNDGELVSSDLQTEVKVAADTKNLYFAIQCFGNQPYNIYGLKRDNELFWGGDVVGVLLDPTNNQSNGYVFAVNPEGVQLEGVLNNQTVPKTSDIQQKINLTWNIIWQSAVQVNKNGWTLEMKIPLGLLRYGNTQQWGINFFRRDAKSNTHHTWSAVPIQFHEISLNHTGVLHWQNKIPKNKSILGLSPYVLNNLEKDVLQSDDWENKIKAGLDSKIRVSKGLNLDITLNPDFSQIDVDRLVTNLSTVNIFFPEQRFFFQENDDLFSDFGIAPMRPFFSRRIGLDENGRAIPILFGGRLSGYLGDKVRIGLMNMHTQTTDETSGTNFTSTALHYQLNPQWLVKSYFHNIQDFDGSEIIPDSFNRLAGLETKYVSGNGKWRGSLGSGFSLTKEKNSQNFFHSMEFGYYGKKLNFFANIARTGDNYTSRIGFFPRMFHYDAERDIRISLGFTHYYGTASYFIYPKEGIFNNHQLNITTIFSQIHDGRWFRNDLRLTYTLNFKNTASLDVLYRMERPELLFPFRFTEEPLPAGQYGFGNWGIIYKSDIRNDLKYEVLVERGTFYDGKQQRYAIDVGYRFPPGLNFSFTGDYTKLSFPENFGSSDLWSLGLNAEVGFSKNLFWTSFLQYNTQRNRFNINSRIQYQLNALSNIYLVYTSSHATDPWEERYGSIALKLNYWLDI